MAQPTAPVADWTDAAVLGYAIGKADHALLRLGDIDTQEYEETRKALKNTGAKNRPGTVEKLKQEHQRAKRALLVELMALRAATGQAQSGQLRTASAVIKMTSDDANKVVDKMMTTMTKATDKMARLQKRHAQLMGHQAEATDRVDRVSDFIEAGDTVDVGEQTGADNNELTEDDVVAQLEAIMDDDSADEERPSNGAGSSTDRNPPVAAPKAEAPPANVPPAEAPPADAPPAKAPPAKAAPAKAPKAEAPKAKAPAAPEAEITA